MAMLRILVPKNNLRRWHNSLFDALSRDGARVEIEMRDGPPRSLTLALLEELERQLLARHHSLLDPEMKLKTRGFSTDATDLTFDLTGQPEAAAGAIFPVYCGVAGDEARDAMILSGAPPYLGLAKKEGERTVLVSKALIALRRPSLLRGGRENVASRLITLIRALVRKGSAEAIDAASANGPPSALVLPSLREYLLLRARLRLQRLIAHEGHWRIGWRLLASPSDAMSHNGWPAGANWTWLRDDRRRYYADPFLFAYEGVMHVFCEEFPYATRKGVISWFPLDGCGRLAKPPRVVLEASCHLSYPFVFRHEGEIWMMPEASSSRSLALYRADPFPERWTPDRLLLDNIEISDATIFEHKGRSWMMAATHEDNGSSWDCLSVFVADSPFGPWRRCGDGHVLIDASAARPAGNLYRRGAGLWRPAQDCTGGYGSGLAFCRVDRLDETSFSQVVESRVGAPPGAQGVHTINTAANFEAVDNVGWSRKQFV